jgi:GNAT superfamily N-acetyltransferase
MIHLQEITRDNFMSYTDLEHTHEFAESAAMALALAYALRKQWTAYGIAQGDTPIGMVHIMDKPIGTPCDHAFSEFFIADDYLRKGNGSAALAAILKKCRENGFDEVRVVVDPENTVLLDFMQKRGFKNIGKADWNEHYFILTNSRGLYL